MHKEEIWSGVTDALLTDNFESSATKLFIKYKSGALVPQFKDDAETQNG